MFSDQAASRDMQIPRTPVVAQTLPYAEHVLFVGLGQRLDRGK
jgi:hypothetical protein